MSIILVQSATAALGGASVALGSPRLTTEAPPLRSAASPPMPMGSSPPMPTPTPSEALSSRELLLLACIAAAPPISSVLPAI